MSGTETRLTEIEIALSHAEAAVDVLDGLVREQGDRIAHLERALAHLGERLAAAETRSPARPDAPPPHY